MKGILVLIGAILLSANLIAVQGRGNGPIVLSSTGSGYYPVWLLRSDGIGMEQVTVGGSSGLSEALAPRTTVILWNEDSANAWTGDRPSLGESPALATSQKAIVMSRRSDLPTESGVVFFAPQGLWKTSGGQTLAGEMHYRLRVIEQ